MPSLFKKALSFLRKAFLVIAVYTVIVSLFSYFLSKDNPSYQSVTPVEKEHGQMYTYIKDPKLNSTKEGKLAIAVYRTVMCTIVGEVCTNNPADAGRYFDQSWFGGMASLIAMPFSHPPASGIYWVQSGLENAGFVPKTYAAQGIGFATLQPIRDLWKIFRDFSYFILVIIIIAIGFMIMFRTKVNPQTVISLESALPRIIFALILITFSFAIAGFLVDLMYILIVLSISLIAKAGAIHPIGDISPKNIPALQNRFIGGTLKDLWPYSQNPILTGNAMVEIMPRIVKDIFKGFIAIGFTILINRFWLHKLDSVTEVAKNAEGEAGFFGNILGFGFGGVPHMPVLLMDILLSAILFPWAAGAVMGILFSVTLLFFLFRVFFMLLSSYIKVILYTVFAPIILLFSAIPGRKAFSWWIKNMFAELMTFPITITLLLLGYVIANLPVPTGGSSLGRFPFLNGLDAEAFSAIVGIGLTLMTPNLVNKAKEALGIKGGAGLGAGTFFAGVGAIGGGATGMISKYASFAYYGKEVPILRSLPFFKNQRERDLKERTARAADPTLGG